MAKIGRICPARHRPVPTARLGNRTAAPADPVRTDEHLQRLTGDILAENGDARVCQKLGFHLQYFPEDQVVKVEFEL